MKTLALAAAALFALSAPLAAWSFSPEARVEAAPADPAPAAEPSESPATPAPEAGATLGTLRLRLNNSGATEASVLLKVTDDKGIPRIQHRDVAARSVAVLDHVLPLGEVSIELYVGPASSMMTLDLSGCASRLLQQNWTISQPDLLSGSVKSGGAWCVPRA